MANQENLPVRKSFMAATLAGALLVGSCSRGPAQFESDHPSATISTEQFSQLSAAARDRAAQTWQEIIDTNGPRSYGSTLYITKDVRPALSNTIPRQDCITTLEIDQLSGLVALSTFEVCANYFEPGQTNEGKTVTEETFEAGKSDKLVLANPDFITYNQEAFNGASGANLISTYLQDPNTVVESVTSDGYAPLGDEVTATITPDSLTIDTSKAQHSLYFRGDLPNLAATEPGTEQRSTAFVDFALSQIDGTAKL
ncbi:MAG: hypothetical protein WBP26_03265 [Candidatus Saccharimonadales bacterium]